MEEFPQCRTLFFFFFWPMVFVGCVMVQRLPVSAVLVGGVGGGAVWLLLPVFAGGPPLVYPVQAARLLEVANLPRG